MLFAEGANIVVADLNEEKEKQFAEEINAAQTKNRAKFIKVNVSDAESVKNLGQRNCASFWRSGC
jgi:sorbitol-6-phosphate 2-dehydrogenase